MKKLTTTKKYTVFLFVNLIMIELYSMIAMWHFGNLDALSVLITSVVGEAVVYISYCLKSVFDHKIGIFDGGKEDECN